MGWATNGSEGERRWKSIQNGNPGKGVGMKEEDGLDVLRNTEGFKAMLCSHGWG